MRSGVHNGPISGLSAKVNKVLPSRSIIIEYNIGFSCGIQATII
jgi:hypothetical protein